jgi:hypothetical protein
MGMLYALNKRKKGSVSSSKVPINKKMSRRRRLSAAQYGGVDEKRTRQPIDRCTVWPRGAQVGRAHFMTCGTGEKRTPAVTSHPYGTPGMLAHAAGSRATTCAKS